MFSRNYALNLIRKRAIRESPYTRQSRPRRDRGSVPSELRRPRDRVAGTTESVAAGVARPVDGGSRTTVSWSVSTHRSDVQREVLVEFAPCRPRRSGSRGVTRPRRSPAADRPGRAETGTRVESLRDLRRGSPSDADSPLRGVGPARIRDSCRRRVTGLRERRRARRDPAAVPGQTRRTVRRQTCV